MIRRFAKRLDDSTYIELVKRMYMVGITSIVNTMNANGTIHIEDPELVKRYKLNQIKAEADFFGYKDKEFMDMYITPSFPDTSHLSWQFSGFRFNLIVDIDDLDGNTSYDKAITNGFTEVEANEEPIYRSQYLKFEDIMANCFPEEFSIESKARPMSITMQVTEDCNLCCTYCYQTNKTKKDMTPEVAKRFIDTILDGNCDYINTEKNPAIILEFMGGEGLLGIELIDEVLTYTLNKMANMNHPWLYRWNSFIGSNGVLYRNEIVQSVLKKWRGVLSLAITLDGCKELHDKCRIFPDGSGSYDLALDAIRGQVAAGDLPNTKLTIAPDNIEYIPEAVKNFVDLGLIHIWMNCIYEEQWTIEQGTLYYTKLKEIADYLIDNNLADSIEFSLFNDKNYLPVSNTDVNNWCGGDGSMLALDPDGVMYNCVRYMGTSLNGEQEPLRIGDLDNGIGVLESDKKNIGCMRCITRKSQSTQECFECPIASGCSWCSAYNYQCFGTPNKRSINICNMHKAQALANTYYWNKYYVTTGSMEVLPIPVEYEFIEGIISEQEYNKIKQLTERK